MTEIRGSSAGPVDGAVDEGDVELAVDDRPRQVAGCTPVQTKSDAGMGLAKAREKGSQVHHAKGLDCTHVQLTTKYPPETGHCVATLVHCGERRPSGRQEGPSSLRQGDAAVVPHEEGLPEFPLERLDRGAETGLHNVNPGGGTGEVLLLGHSHEVLKLAKLHISILSML